MAGLIRPYFYNVSRTNSRRHLMLIIMTISYLLVSLVFFRYSKSMLLVKRLLLCSMWPLFIILFISAIRIVPSKMRYK